MRRSVIICAMLLSGCADRIVTVYVTPDVPQDLRQPVAAPCRPAVIDRDAGDCLLNKTRGLAQANAKIMTIDDILTKAAVAKPR